MRLLFILLSCLLLQAADAQIIQFSGAQAAVQVDIVSTFGATCNGDAQLATRTVTTTSGSKNLSVTVDTFAPSDVGKVIRVDGLNSNTIATVTDAQHIVLGTNASATISGVSKAIGWGTDDADAFAAFNVFAVTQTTVQVVLTIPSGKTCQFLTFGTGSFGVNFARGIKNLLISGYGATLSSPLDDSPFFILFNLGGIGVCQSGLANVNGCSARTASVSAGATSVTLLNTALCSRFVTGRYALMTGFDLQGIWQTSYGFPPNFHYIDYVLITDTSSCNATGAISFTALSTGAGLQYSYLSTWPNYYDGDGPGGGVDDGGPATLYALNANWDTTVEVRGLTISQNHQTTIGRGRSFTYRDVTFTGAACGIPTENFSWTAVNYTGTSCHVETDKLVGSITVTGSSLAELIFQSSSIDLLTLNGNTTISGGLNGTPKRAVVSNTTLGSLGAGAIAYGRSDETSCTNCAITQVNSGSYAVNGTNNAGVNFTMSMSGGVISYPNGTTITGMADNGSGKVRLTVNSSTGYVTGNTYTIDARTTTATCVVSTIASEVNGDRIVTVVDGTHIDVPSVTYLGNTFCSGTFKSIAPTWAVPGTNLQWIGAQESETIFQVTGVTQDAQSVHIQTSLAGGFPPVALTGGGLLKIGVHPAPKFTCTNCTGSTTAVDLSGAPAQAPLWSYSSRPYTAAQMTGVAINCGVTPDQCVRLWGTPAAATAITVTVNQACTGVTFPTLVLGLFGQFKATGTDPPDYSSATNWQPAVNVKTTGTRTYNGGTNTWSGTVAGDSLLPATSGAIWFGGQQQQSANHDFTAECPAGTIATITATTSQGVVIP